MNDLRDRLNDLRNRLPIDQFNLEEECMMQAALYDEAGSLSTDTRKAAREAKGALEFVTADLSFRIRKNPESFGIDKVTEKSVESAIILQKEYEDALAEYILAQKVAEDFGVLQTAVEQRKSLIRELVTLYVHSYYSSQHDMDGEKKSVGQITKDQIVQRRIEIAKQRNNPEEIEEEQE